VTSHSKLAACHKERKWGRKGGMEESKRRGAEGEDRDEGRKEGESNRREGKGKSQEGEGSLSV